MAHIPSGTTQELELVTFRQALEAADTQQAQLLHRMIETLLQINCPDPTIGR